MQSDAQKPTIVGLGELLWDCFADGRRPGGAPANVAFQACLLGGEGIVCSRVGADPLGDELIGFLAAQGLATDWIQRDPAHPTGTVTVDTSQPDHPRYTIHENVAWDHIAFDDALASLASLAGREAAVCFGTLAQRCDASRSAIREMLDCVGPQCLVVYDVNLRQHYYQRDWVEHSLRRADVVKLNADEVTALDRLLEWSSPDARSFARRVQERHDVAAVCITRAEQGCFLADGDQWIESPGVRVKLVDAVGAGDAFTAALIVARLRGWPPDRQAALANAVGALVASRPGAMPPLREEFACLLAQHAGGGVL